ncbi:uncharacterized protein LOC143183423 [Calliopsis andreniformis]|uniref:uncharacterized protein LOC143183423 n=1 Tax=Calliopsis andreniformis TaxID=337506 RepID=UPI003FCEDA3B
MIFLCIYQTDLQSSHLSSQYLTKSLSNHQPPAPKNPLPDIPSKTLHIANHAEIHIEISLSINPGHVSPSSPPPHRVHLSGASFSAFVQRTPPQATSLRHLTPQCLAGFLSVRFLSPSAASCSLSCPPRSSSAWLTARPGHRESFRSIDVRRSTRGHFRPLPSTGTIPRAEGQRRTPRQRPRDRRLKGEEERRTGEERGDRSFPRIPEHADRRGLAPSWIVCKYVGKYPRTCAPGRPRRALSASTIVAVIYAAD